MAVTSREQLKQYALRALGVPVLKINVADEQLEDRIDEAIEFFRLYHYDGIEKVYMKHKITPSTLTITGTNAADFVVGTEVVGQTSGAKGKVQLNEVDNVIRVRDVIGEFVDGELVNNGTFTATLVANDAYELGDTENKYIPIPDSIYGVIRVIPFRQGMSSANLFDAQYQLRLNDLYEITHTSVVYYQQVMTHMTMLDQVLNGFPIFEFNRIGGKLELPIKWSNLAVDDYIIIECYRAIDPQTNVKVWSDPWLKRYVEVLFKKQWGQNLSKFQNMQLPGGVVMDGVAMYQTATQEQNELEDELQNKSAPLSFFTG